MPSESAGNASRSYLCGDSAKLTPPKKPSGRHSEINPGKWLDCSRTQTRASAPHNARSRFHVLFNSCQSNLSFEHLPCLLTRIAILFGGLQAVAGVCTQCTLMHTHPNDSIKVISGYHWHIVLSVALKNNICFLFSLIMSLWLLMRS